MKIAFIGGGQISQSVASLAMAKGHRVSLGVRNRAGSPQSGMPYTTFAEAVVGADLVFIAVPFDAVKAVMLPLADALIGKIVIDATNPVARDWSPILIGEEESGAEQVARMLPESLVAKAFNTIFADMLKPARLDRGGQPITLFVVSDNDAAVIRIMALGAQMGLAPVNAGPLKSARYLEAIAHLNIELAVRQGGGTNAAFIYSRAY